MMRDEIFKFESFINWWGDLLRMGNLEDHKDFGALHPSFEGLGSRTATALYTLYLFIIYVL